jgi:PAS domain S-box-containing protein
MKKVNIKLDISTKKQIYIIVLLLSIFIVAFGYWYYSAEKKQIIHQKEQTLKSIATLKAKQVVDWYNDELCDAGVMADNPFLQEILASYYMRPSDSNFARLVDILKQCKIEHELADVILTTPDGKVIASATNSFERLASQEIASINSSAKSGKSVSTDFFRISENGQDKIFISFTSTIELRGTSHYSLVFRADPNDFLYPLIESWPLPSQTAESYLFRVEGDSIVFLSNLRHNKFTALSFKLPISIEKYSLRGILDGNENHFTRKDYRKVEVKSYATQLVGTPWYLVSEVDKSELLNELPRTALKVILQILFIVLFAVFTIAYLYRTRQKNIFENLYKAEKELWQQNEKFRVTIDSLGDGVIVTDMKSIIQFMNLRAEQLTGWRFREAKGRNLSEVYTVKNEQTGLKENNILEKVIKKGIVKELANHTLLIAKNGDEIPVMDTGAPIYNSNGEITGIVIAFQDETERRQQKRLLVDSEARYRDFFEADLTGDYIATPDGEILDCNPAFIEILGYATAEELIGRNIAEMYKSPTEREEFLNLIQNQKVVRNYKSKLKRKDGTNIICIRNSVGKFDDNGKLVKYFSYIYDITDQIHAEEEIRKNDSFFRLIFANTPDVLFIQDCNLTYSFIINPPHPLTPEDVVGKSDWDLLPPEEAKVLTELKTKIIETGEPIRQEICLSPGGIQRWYDVIYQPIFESDGQKVCIASYSRDITERKFSEEALIKKDQLLSSVMETQQEFICRYLPDTTLTFVNKAYCKHFGRSENEVVGQNYLQFMPKSEWDLELSRLAQLNKQNPSITSISQAYKADGSLISIEWTDLAIFNAQNEVVEIQSVGRDITEQLKAEQEVIFQSQMQEMLRTIASTYINIPLELVDYEIQNSLEKLGRFVEADRAYIFDYDWVKNTCSNTYEWCQDGIEPQIQVLQNFPLGDISQWVNAHKTGKTLYIPDVFELEINDAVRQILEPQGIKSLLTIPIMRDDVCIGFLGFDSVSKHHTYSEADEKLLSIFAQLIVNVKNREILESSLVIEKEKANESNRLKTSFLQNLSLVIRTPKSFFAIY